MAAGAVRRRPHQQGQDETYEDASMRIAGHCTALLDGERRQCGARRTPVFLIEVKFPGKRPSLVPDIVECFSFRRGPYTGNRVDY